jgi:hypothetical protein
MTPEPPHDEPASASADPRDRRAGGDRRAGTKPPAGVERRRGDRRGGPPVPEQYRAGARHMNEYPLHPDEMEFINAITAYKTKHSRPFPTWSEVLHVVKALGYVKSDAAPRAPQGE